MGGNLIEKWLRHYDPIHHGWTPAGIANGVCATNGYSFPRILGGYNLIRAPINLPPHDGQLVGAAGHDATTIRIFPWIIHEPNGRYAYRLTAIGSGGVENSADGPVDHADFDETARWTGARPAAPSDLHVQAISGGRFLLKWSALDDGQVKPTAYHVYHDAGTGTIDYNTIRHIIQRRHGSTHHQCVSEVFADGARVRWAVRAVAADALESKVESMAVGWARSTPPPAPDGIRVSCVASR